MALGKTIVATSIGAEGIHYADGKDILIADTPQAFVNAIGRCIEDRSFSDQLGQASRHLIEQEYDNQALVGRLVRFYEEL